MYWTYFIARVKLFKEILFIFNQLNNNQMIKYELHKSSISLSDQLFVCAELKISNEFPEWSGKMRLTYNKDWKSLFSQQMFNLSNSTFDSEITAGKNIWYQASNSKPKIVGIKNNSKTGRSIQSFCLVQFFTLLDNLLCIFHLIQYDLYHMSPFSMSIKILK